MQNTKYKLLSAICIKTIFPQGCISRRFVNGKFSSPQKFTMFLVLSTLAFLALSHADVSHLGLSHGYQYERPQHTLNVPASHQHQVQHHVVTEVQQAPVHYHYEVPAAVSYQAPIQQHYEVQVEQHHAAPAPVTYQAPVQQHYEAPAPVQQHYEAPAPISYQAPVQQHYEAPAPVQQHYEAPAPVQQHYEAPAPVSYQAPVQQHYEAPAPVTYQQVSPVSVPNKYLPPAPIHVHEQPQAKVEVEYHAPITATVEREYLPPAQQRHEYSVPQISHPAPVHEQTVIPSVPASISYQTPEVQTYSAPASETGGYHYGTPIRRFRS